MSAPHGARGEPYQSDYIECRVAKPRNPYCLKLEPIGETLLLPRVLLGVRPAQTASSPTVQ